MYSELTREHQARILREHLLALEGEHYRTTLALTEEVTQEGRQYLLGRIADCERRIAVHTSSSLFDPADGTESAEPT